MQEAQVGHRTQHARHAACSCSCMRARFTVISFHLKHIMVGDHISNVLKYCDAVPGIVVRDEPKEEIENSIAELPIADLHLLACPAPASPALR